MFIKTIRFENLKAFKKLEFDLERPNGQFPGWTVFVGGNASGKSTLLKGVALALLGPETGRQLMGNPVGWIRKGEKRATASVKIVVDQEHDQFKRAGRTSTRFDAGIRWQQATGEDIPDFRALKEREKGTGTRIEIAERGPWDPNSSGWFSAGYGPMRRLSGSSSESIRYSVGGGIVSRYVTLFREDAALSESEEWLRKTHSRTLESPQQQKWKRLLEGVTELLSDGLLPHGMKISRITVDHVFVKDERDVELPMRDISDGCRGVYATVLDLVHGMFEVFGADGLFDKDSANHTILTRPGIVLIDEMEAHLHPAWQRDIPYWLKTRFPNTQFLIATHSPLIAQAADPNGIFLLPLQDEIERKPRALTPEEYEKIRWGSAHKTVLGVAFGLDSTRSRWANQQIERWKRLEAKKRAGLTLSPTETKDHAELRQKLLFDLNEDESANSVANHAPAASENPIAEKHSG